MANPQELTISRQRLGQEAGDASCKVIFAVSCQNRSARHCLYSTRITFWFLFSGLHLYDLREGTIPVKLGLWRHWRCGDIFQHTLWSLDHQLFLFFNFFDQII